MDPSDTEALSNNFNARLERALPFLNNDALSAVRDDLGRPLSIEYSEVQAFPDNPENTSEMSMEPSRSVRIKASGLFGGEKHCSKKLAYVSHLFDKIERGSGVREMIYQIAGYRAELFREFSLLAEQSKSGELRSAS